MNEEMMSRKRLIYRRIVFAFLFISLLSPLRVSSQSTKEATDILLLLENYKKGEIKLNYRNSKTFSAIGEFLKKNLNEDGYFIILESYTSKDEIIFCRRNIQYERAKFIIDILINQYGFNRCKILFMEGQSKNSLPKSGYYAIRFKISFGKDFTTCP